MKPRRAARTGALVLSLVLCAACSFLYPLDGYKGGGSHGDAAIDVDEDAGEDAGTDSGTGCALSRWPARPSTDDGTDDVEVVNALMTFAAEADPDAGPGVVQGYDLDGVCTCPASESCKPRAGVRPHCDEPGGVDNSGGQLLKLIATLVDRNADTNGRLRSGDYGLLVRLRGYNGGANDTQVEVAIFLSNGTDGIQDGGVPPKPKYDGTDRWTVDPKSLAGGTAPPYVPNFVDGNAYVTNHVLVATADFSLRLGRMTVQLVGSTVTGTLVKDSVGYHVDDGIISGRVLARSLLTNLAPIDDPFVPGGHLCGASTTYQDIKSKVCETADVVSDLKQDNTGATCDALSVSAHFTSSTALLGRVFGLPAPATPCGPQWVDDCTR